MEAKTIIAIALVAVIVAALSFFRLKTVRSK